jgi:myo-inositol-1(or 4)-monophosphatase
MTRAETALDAATAGAAVAEEYYRTALDAETKTSAMDFVTEGDRRAQRQVIETIRSAYPDATVVGEEEDELKTVPHGADCWVVDPIDGTSNFVHEIPIWCTAVAAIEDGDPVGAATVAPALEEVFHASERAASRGDDPLTVSETSDLARFNTAAALRYGPERDESFGDLLSALIVAFGDLRRFGSAQVTLALVAAGSLDAAASLQPDPNPWDTVAGVYLIERAGGTVTDRHGDPWQPGSEGLVATNGQRHEAVLDVVQSAAAD